MQFAWAHGRLTCAAGPAGEQMCSQRRGRPGPYRAGQRVCMLLTVPGHRPWGKRVGESGAPVSSASQASQGAAPVLKVTAVGGGVWCECGGGQAVPSLLDPLLRHDCHKCLCPPHGLGSDWALGKGLQASVASSMGPSSPRTPRTLLSPSALLSASGWQTRRERDGDVGARPGGCARCVVNARL